jgi:hypothetical protein
MLRASLFASVFASLLLLGLVACGPKPGGKLMVDTPALTYQPPDIEELSGVSDDEDEAKPEPAKPEPAAATPAPAPSPAIATPAPPPKATTPAPAAAAKPAAPPPAKK